MRVQFSSSEVPQSVEFGDSTYVANGFLGAYDGATFTEHGHHLYPQTFTGVDNGATTGSMGAGTYLYKLVYEYTNNKGEIVRSATSLPLTQVVAAGTSSVTLTIPTLRITGHTVVIRVYRTEAGGTIYYRASATNTPLNVASLDTVTFTDTTASTGNSSKEQIYTSGGVLDNDAPPPCDVLCVAKNRLMVVSKEDGYVYYSKKRALGYAAEFNRDSFVPIESQNGLITAIAELDDKVICFKNSSIYYFYGEGPNDTGAGGAFSDMARVPGDVGCVNARSVIATPNGIIFMSRKGMHSLGRDLTTQYIGAPVETYNTQTITSAIAVPNTTHIRFTTSSGSTLVYDYYFNQWGTFSNHLALDAVVSRNTYYYMRTNGRVWQETSGVYTDNGTAVGLSLTTAWIRFSVLRGFQRIRRALFTGESSGSVVVGIAFAYDYLTSTLSSALSTTVSGAFRHGIQPETQKVQAMQFTLSERTPSTNSLVFNGLDIEYGIKGNLSRQPNTSGGV